MTLAPIITRLFTTVWVWTELALCLSVPFFFAGVVISLALTRSPFPIARVYGANSHRTEKTAQNAGGIPQNSQIIGRASTLIFGCEKI
jgi:hypothetical protein